MHSSVRSTISAWTFVQLKCFVLPPLFCQSVVCLGKSCLLYLVVLVLCTGFCRFVLCTECNFSRWLFLLRNNYLLLVYEKAHRQIDKQRDRADFFSFCPPVVFFRLFFCFGLALFRQHHVYSYVCIHARDPVKMSSTHRVSRLAPPSLPLLRPTSINKGGDVRGRSP